MKKALFLLMFLCANLFADIGFDVAWQSRWRDGNLFNVAVIFPNNLVGYMAAGFNFQANKRENYPVPDLSGMTEYKTHSLYGTYAGYFLNLSPIFRPGAVFGIGWESDEKFIGNQRAGYTSFKFTPYFGLDIHCWFLTFRVSNEGIGGGINIRFGG